MKKDFKIARDGKTEAAKMDQFIEGVEPETTKTFRLPVRLSRSFKSHAAAHGLKEKDILIRLMEEYLEEHA